MRINLPERFSGNYTSRPGADNDMFHSINLSINYFHLLPHGRGKVGMGVENPSKLNFLPHLYPRLWHPASFYLLLPCSRPPARGEEIYLCIYSCPLQGGGGGLIKVRQKV